MVAARSAAMAFNRLVDAKSTPAIRAPACATFPPACSRAVSPGDSSLVSAAVFLFAAGRLNPLCLRLAPLALAVVFCYSFTKRFTSFSHLVLGLSARHRARRRLDRRARLARPAHSLAHRRRHFLDRRLRRHLRLPGLRIRLRRSACGAFPASGHSGALWVARFLHVLMVVCLLALVHALRWELWPGRSGAVAALLIYEHSLVHADDLSRVNAAFFTMNGWVSVLFFVFWAADIFLPSPGV
jgi:4-hydroxybenzoate polyprenyltransferase